MRKIFTAERVEQLKLLAKSPDIYERLSRALGVCVSLKHVQFIILSSAPSIYENDDIKKGILLQLFGGAKKDFKNTGRSQFRCPLFFCVPSSSLVFLSLFFLFFYQS